MAAEKNMSGAKIALNIFVGACTVMKTIFEITTPKSTESLGKIHTLFENGDIGSSEYAERKAEIFGD